MFVHRSGDLQSFFLRLVQRSDALPPAQRRLRSDGPPDAPTEIFTIYGHAMTHTDARSVAFVTAAKNSYINSVPEDLESRFEGFDSVTAAFDCIFKVLE